MVIKASYGKKFSPDNHLHPSLPIAQALADHEQKNKKIAISGSKGLKCSSTTQ